MLEAHIDLQCDPALVGVARRFVDRRVAEWELDPIRDSALVIVTELATNAVLHARTPFRVTVRSNGFGFLRIEVRDVNRRMPRVAPAACDATSGRGLEVVGALAEACGTVREGDGKVVWAEIGTRASGNDSGRLDLSELDRFGGARCSGQAVDDDLAAAGDEVQPLALADEHFDVV